MGGTFWTVVFAVGVAQGVLLFTALLLRPGTNRRATGLLAGMLATFTLMILGGVVGEALSGRPAQLVMFLNINSELAIGPLLLLWVRALLRPDPRLTPRAAAHFLPLGLALGLSLVAWVVIGERPGEHPFQTLQPIVPAYVVVKAVYLFSYVALAYRTLDRGLREPARFVAERRPVELRWLKPGLLVLGGGAALLYLANFVEFWGPGLPFRVDPFGSMVLAAMICLISLMMLVRPWVLSLKPRGLDAERWAEDCRRLTAYLDGERPWLEADFRLADLAEALETTENHLSTVINEGLDTTFHALVNRYRLAEFERLSRTPAHREWTVLDLAFEAGFNSKASFYRVFRDTHGSTPAAFRRAL